MRTRFAIGAALAAFTSWGCGGSGYGSSAGSPTAASSVPTGAVIVSIVGSAGPAAFSPNPVAVAAGGVLVWKNSDVTTHHIVLDDGSADFGDLGPGGTTRALTVTSSSVVPFHCTLHPTMVGSINGTTVATTQTAQAAANEWRGPRADAATAPPVRAYAR